MCNKGNRNRKYKPEATVLRSVIFRMQITPIFAEANNKHKIFPEQDSRGSSLPIKEARILNLIPT